MIKSKPSESSTLENKPDKHPIWNYFKLCENDKARAVCNSCNESKSLGNVAPKFQTKTNLKNHLKSRHLEIFNKLLKCEEELKSKKRPRNEEVFFL